MTKPVELNDRIARITRELAEINRAMTPEITPQERLALLKLEHSAAGAAIEALETQAREQKWSGRPLASMSRSEKAQMIGDLGVKAFLKRVEAEHR
jgi:hypothetical protein